MTLDSELFAGLAPSGLGLYVRDDVHPGFAFYAVEAGRPNTARIVAQAKATGRQVWLYRTPEAWHPDTWEASCDALYRENRALGTAGYIADAESEWPELLGSTRRRALQAFGEKLERHSHDMRIGFTSYPLFPDLDTLARATRGRVWGSPQLYSRNLSQPASVLRAWNTRWTSLFPSVAPGIAGWQNGNPEMLSEAGTRSYLSRLPRVGGALVWTTPTTPRHILRALSSFNPSGSAIQRAAFMIGNAARHPYIPILLAFVVALLIFAGVRR